MVVIGWFDEQIKKRIYQDEESFTQSFAELSSVIVGKKAVSGLLPDEHEITQNSIGEILNYYHVKPAELPSEVKELGDQLDYLLRPSGIMRRPVKLTDKWYKDSAGAMLGQTVEGGMVALIPRKLSGYEYMDWITGERIRVTKKTAGRLKPDALCFYKPLPLRSLSIFDLMKYIIGTLSVADYIFIAAAAAATTLIGMLMPAVNNTIFSQVIPAGDISLLLPLAALLIGITAATSLFGIVQSLVMARVNTKMDISVEAASMARVMSLPAAFFKDYSAGELSARAQSINSLCKMLADSVLSTGLGTLFSLVYITQIWSYAPSLAIPAICAILASLIVSVAVTLLRISINRKRIRHAAKLSGLVFSLFSGIQKIKLSGAERRAFSKWANKYKEEAELTYAPPMIIRLSSVLTAVIASIGTIVIYYYAAISQVSVADYMSFNVAFGMVSAGVMALSSVASTLSGIRPVMEMVEPVLKAIPETDADKKPVTRLSGGIELNNISFRYAEHGPMILNNLSLKIRPGQYVAIVGKTGCGKSTLMRILLGFEKPQKGAVYYDGKDIDHVDIKSLRRNIGVVMQNGKLFQGDVFSNIIISAPWLSMDEAWEAAEIAGIADDIRRMPMGMHTIISEGSGGVSGGQKQRMMIARAVAPKPRVLMFDEATSALDNITQKHVSDSLGKLKSTRIVIAHRLSTIRQCDRIIVLDQGRIIEDGTYEALIAQKGFFAELVEHQRIDTEPEK